MRKVVCCMIDRFNEITSFSPFGGQLIREEVKGRAGKRVEMEERKTTRLNSRHM